MTARRIKNLRLPYILIVFPGLFLLFTMMSWEHADHQMQGKTQVCKWRGDKTSALSITFDDGILTQFTVARPILNNLDLPATFFILTGKIDGSQKGRFLGRAKEEIVEETSTIKTNSDNFFERASLIGHTGTDEGQSYHARAGSLFEAGKVNDAYELMDEAYEKLRNGKLRNTGEVVYHDNRQDTTSWNDLRAYAAEGHEIASHTITHPRLAVLDEKNMMYELQQSQEDIRANLGEPYTFSAECPYGTEDERVMQYAHSVYPALRNRMPADYIDELNRSSKKDPGSFEKEYVQWQRGPLTGTSMDMMKSWINTCLGHDNIWLVLVFHGVDHLGWEPKTREELSEYFTYIKNREDDIWVATFAEVTKYIRQRENMKISSRLKGDAIVLILRPELDAGIYNATLTFKTYIPSTWKHVTITQGKTEIAVKTKIGKDQNGSFVMYDLKAPTGEYIISGA